MLETWNAIVEYNSRGSKSRHVVVILVMKRDQNLRFTHCNLITRSVFLRTSHGFSRSWNTFLGVLVISQKVRTIDGLSPSRTTRVHFFILYYFPFMIWISFSFFVFVTVMFRTLDQKLWKPLNFKYAVVNFMIKKEILRFWEVTTFNDLGLGFWFLNITVVQKFVSFI